MEFHTNRGGALTGFCPTLVVYSVTCFRQARYIANVGSRLLLFFRVLCGNNLVVNSGKQQSEKEDTLWL
jgi:hypothetical protein